MTLEELKDSLTTEDIIRIMESLGASCVQETDSYLLFPTICHNLDPDMASKKLYYYKDRKLFHCYTECGDSFTIYTLFQRYYKLRNIRYDFYKDIFLPITQGKIITEQEDFFGVRPYQSEKSKFERKNRKVELPEYPKGILNMFVNNYYDGWILEGISEESMEKYDISYSISQNKIIIPHYDINNRLVGIRGRALSEEIS